MSWFLVSAIILVALLLVLLSPVYPVRICHPKKGKTLVAITLDDGYRCWTSTIMPILADHNLTATAFINNSDYQKDFTWADIQKLHKAGWEIGWHTSKHMELPFADSTAIVSDFRNSKALFESHGLPKPVTFAYPFGRHDSKSMEIASHYFNAGRTIHYGVNTPCYINDNPYHIKVIKLQTGLSFLKKQVKKYLKQRVFIVIFAHTIGETADWQDETDMTVEDFEELVRFLHQEEQDGNIDVVTFNEGVTRIKKENTNHSWELKFDSPCDPWYHLFIFPVPRRYVMIYEIIIDDIIGHRFPRAARMVRKLIRSLKAGEEKPPLQTASQKDSVIP